VHSSHSYRVGELHFYVGVGDWTRSNRSAFAVTMRRTGVPEGETALDLGSGGGIDVLLSARRVKPTASR
jgi:hypothetical protein